jgi:hypothetical protein
MKVPSIAFKIRKLRFRAFSFLFVICLFGGISFGQNPILRDMGVSDPHIRVFNDKLYLYSGHDSSPDDKTWIMKDWRIFFSTNLLDWTLEETISPKDNYMGDSSSDCWAGDAATRNGKYYFYFSDRRRGIGVMESYSPAGPFKDAINKPLVSPLHDPTILIDDDINKTPYILYGEKSDSYFIARLNDDMISIAESPKPISIKGEEWEKAPNWMDKYYLFKHNNTYYLSWGRDYAVSKNIYGPYYCVGAVGNGHHLNEFAHGSFFWWKGQFYHIWCYYIRPGYKYRESIITYCHFDNNGNIVTDTDFLDKHFYTGVGQYNSSWHKIEAEWYYEISSGIKKKGSRENGFVLTGIKNGSWIKFANVNFEGINEKFVSSINCTGGKGTIEIIADSLSGLHLGAVSINVANNSPLHRIVSCKIENIKGVKDIYLKFIGDENYKMEIDYFKFCN